MVDFDLDDFDTVAACENGLTFPVKNLQGEGTNLQISVYGVHSKAFTTARTKRDARKAKILKERSKVGDVDAKLTQEEEEEILGEFTAECIIGWEGIKLKGKDFPYSKANAKTLVKNYPLIAVQVYEKIHSLQEFMEKPQTPSETIAE